MSEAPRSEKVENRSELRSVLENSLIAPEQEERHFIPEEEGEHSVKPKTYLIESNSELKNLVSDGYELTPSNDETLWNLLCHDGKRPFYMYLDMLDKRFWVVHSTYYADRTHEVVSELVSRNQSKLDFTWFSSDALLEIGQSKVTTGFGINYENLFAPEGEKSGLSARVWGKEIPSVLTGLRKIGQIENQISVNSVTIQHQTGVGHVNEDIFRNGRLTAKGGDSIDNHLDLIETVKSYYSKLIAEIEHEYITRYNYAEHYCTVSGSYSVISFQHFIPNLRLFAEVLTSGNDPFRIWGIWKPITENHIKVNGIDQHTNTPVELELMPDEMRIILGEGTCGNIVTRLFTNIQARFDSNCTLKGLDNAYIIRAHEAN